MKKIILAIFMLLVLTVGAQHKTQREVRRGERTLIIENKPSGKSRSKLIGVYDKAQWNGFKNKYAAKGVEPGGMELVKIAISDSELKASIRKVFTDVEIRKYDKLRLFFMVGLDSHGNLVMLRVSCDKNDDSDISDDKLIELQQALVSSLKFSVSSTKAPYYYLTCPLRLDRLLTDTPMFPLKSYKNP